MFLSLLNKTGLIHEKLLNNYLLLFTINLFVIYLAQIIPSTVFFSPVPALCMRSVASAPTGHSLSISTTRPCPAAATGCWFTSRIRSPSISPDAPWEPGSRTCSTTQHNTSTVTQFVKTKSLIKYVFLISLWNISLQFKTDRLTWQVTFQFPFLFLNLFLKLQVLPTIISKLGLY